MRGEGGKTQKDKLLTAPELQDIYILKKRGGKGTTLKCQVLSGLLLRLRQPHG